MCGCAGGWKGCEACALSVARISTAPFRLYSVSQSHAQRVNFENSNHLVDASFHSGELTNCYGLKWLGRREGDKRHGLTCRALLCYHKQRLYPCFLCSLSTHEAVQTSLGCNPPPQRHVVAHVLSIKRTQMIPAHRVASWSYHTDGEIKEMAQKRS